MLGGGTGAGIPSWGCLEDHRGECLLTSPLPTAHLCPSHLGGPKTGETQEPLRWLWGDPVPPSISPLVKTHRLSLRGLSVRP